MAAVKFLADLELYRPDSEDNLRKQMEAEVAGVRAKLARMIRTRANSLKRQGKTEFAAEFRAAAIELFSPEAERELAKMRGVTVGDLDHERAQAVLQGLVDIGLIAPRSKVEELAEQRAQERLQALKAEHGIPA